MNESQICAVNFVSFLFNAQFITSTFQLIDYNGNIWCGNPHPSLAAEIYNQVLLPWFAV